jgi:hypothetical protein
MKAKMLVGAIAALMYGGTALAQDVPVDENTQGQQSPDNLGLPQEDSDIIMQEEVAPPVTPQEDAGVGGAGLQQEAIGGSGQVQKQPQAGIPMKGKGGVTLYCTPVEEQATGGAGEFGIPQQQQLQPQPLPPAPQEQSSLERDYDVGEVEVGEVEAFGGAGYEPEKHKADMRGLTVTLGGGVEGYTGALASEINLGPAAGVTASLRPNNIFGLELGYTGAINNLDVDVPGGSPDFVRNGAQAALTVGLTSSPIQPYLLGGFGMNWLNMRNGEAIGFRDDTYSQIPAGLGLRTHFGNLTADLRANYNFLISDDFAPARVETDQAVTGSYNGTLNIGGTF